MNPTNECARVACILEGNFIYDIFLLWSNSEYKITTSEQFLKGNFDKAVPWSSLSPNEDYWVPNLELLIALNVVWCVF